ncbi:MAG: rhamnulokinase [Clostridia bacterium]|nr:rhamnulokinase [Clostridia bacterium]
MKKIKMLAVDLGASSGRTIVGGFDGEKLTLEENHRFPNEPVILNGTFTWDIVRIFHEIKQSLNKCATGDDRDIKTIGIDTWGVDYGFIDKNGRLMANPAHYRDARNDKAAVEAHKAVSRADIYRASGIQYMSFNTVYQLYADKLFNPYLLENADKMLFVPDLLNYFLTGEKRCEYTIASTGAVLDPYTRKVNSELLEKLGINDKLFAQMAMPGDAVGKLSSYITDEIGSLDASVVNVASHDTASAVVAVPAGASEDFVYISSGTWSLMGSENKAPIISEDSLKYDFTNEGGFGGKIRFLKNIMGLWLEQESRRQYRREGKEYSFNDLSVMAKETKPCQSIINPDHPSFSAPGNLPARIAEYCKETGQYVPTTPGEIVRTIFDSLALRYRWTLERIDELKGKKTPFINIVGGGTQEVLLSQITADACKVPVYTGPVEATAAGNLLVQAISLGEIKDLAQAREVVKNSFEIKYYEPDHTSSGMWDAAYDKFLTLIERDANI